jgi:para-nitrobenzyl esterase
MHPEVDTTSGTLRGLDREGHLAFLGVRYAQAPDGARRFLPPQRIVISDVG